MPISHIIQARFTGWNIHVHTERDVIKFCNRHKVRILADPTSEYGSLCYYQGHIFLIVNPFLDQGLKTWVLLHEVAHFILHYPATSYFSRSMRRKNDREANYFAAIAMMPRPAIEGKTIDEVVAEFDYPRHLVRIRFRICQDEGI